MLHLTVKDLENVYDVGEAKAGMRNAYTFHLPEVFASAKGVCGCTASKLDNDTLEVMYLPKPDEKNTVTRKTIKLFRPDGSEQKLQFNATVK